MSLRVDAFAVVMASVKAAATGSVKVEWHQKPGAEVREGQKLGTVQLVQETGVGPPSAIVAPVDCIVGHTLLRAGNHEVESLLEAGVGWRDAVEGRVHVRACLGFFCSHPLRHGGGLCAVCGEEVAHAPRFFPQRGQVSLADWVPRPGGTASDLIASDITSAPAAPAELVDAAYHWPIMGLQGSFERARAAAGHTEVQPDFHQQHQESQFHKVNVLQGGTLHARHDRVADGDAKMAQHLRGAQKLSLILDVDHTLLHATVDPRAAVLASQRSDVIQLDGRMRSHWVKLRPGLRRFLEIASRHFELSINTAGNRLYAEAVARALDPSQRLFGRRIASRDDGQQERGKELGWSHGSLRDHSMVLILDDQGAVWRWAANLLLLKPYRFWKGAQEVNNPAGALLTMARLTAEPPAAPVGGKRDQRPHPGPGDNGAHLDAEEPPLAASEEPRCYLADVLNALLWVHSAFYSQPVQAPIAPARLLEPFEKVAAGPSSTPAAEPGAGQEAAGAAASAGAGEGAGAGAGAGAGHGGDSPPTIPADDGEVDLQQPEEVPGASGPAWSPVMPADKAPEDTGVLLKARLASALQGTVIVFSGVFQGGYAWQQDALVQRAQAMGAQVQAQVTDQTTHVVAPAWTAKTADAAARAAKGQKVAIVRPQWLLESIWRYAPVSAKGYALTRDPANAPAAKRAKAD